MKTIKFFFVFMFSILIVNSNAQSLTITGHTKFEEEPLPEVNIRAMVGQKVFAETTSDKNGHFTLKLDFHLNYSIYFEKQDYVTMHADVDGTMPEEKDIYKIKYEITIPFYHVRNQTINKAAFEKPFSKIYFDGKTKFVDDLNYFKEFFANLNTLPVIKQPEIIKPVVTEKLVQIAGKVVNDNESKTPYNLAKVILLDSNNNEIAATLTNRFGIFNFSNVSNKKTSKIVVVPADNSLKGNIIIQNLNKEQLAILAIIEGKKLEFLNNDSSHLVEQLVNDTFIPFLCGKISVEENNDNTILANKNIYLISDNNNVIETVTTDMFGNFLFSKLPPNKNFIIAIDEHESGLHDNSKLHLYSYKDIEINKKDTLQNGKFLFNFLASDVKAYNDLLVEEINIKMNLKGKIVGDNENNPLSNLRIVLLDKNNNVIDTATTNRNGDFVAKYLPYTDQLTLRFADSTKLQGYSSVIIYDENGKIVKYISIKNGGHFDYKMLARDLKYIDELYLDDPWLNLAKNDKNKTKKNMVIIENIYFEFNQSTLLPSAKQTLDKAIVAMKNNSAMNIDISAHSDSKGSDDYNLKLSEKRAQSALAYIVSKGIEKSRVSAKGYGETKLLNKCGNKVECPEEEHAKNRRLEFNITLK